MLLFLHMKDRTAIRFVPVFTAGNQRPLFVRATCRESDVNIFSALGSTLDESRETTVWHGSSKYLLMRRNQVVCSLVLPSESDGVKAGNESQL